MIVRLERNLSTIYTLEWCLAKTLASAAIQEKVMSIKTLRNLSGMDLLEAKLTIEALRVFFYPTYTPPDIEWYNRIDDVIVTQLNHGDKKFVEVCVTYEHQ